MTTDKARKQAVRARMAKTGESYTAARRHLVDDGRAGSGPAAQAPDLDPLPPRIAQPETSDAAVVGATGRDWDAWFRILDAAGAATMRHGEMAAWLVKAHDVSGWWSQSITVSYERARGLRQVHQRPDGFYVGVSKTFDAGVSRLWAAFTDPELQATWLEPDAVRLRAATPDRTARFDFRDGPSRVNVGFVAKGPKRALVAVEHARLRSAEEVESMRRYWRERLAKLAATLD